MFFDQFRFANCVLDGAPILAVQHNGSYFNLTGGLVKRGGPLVTSTDDILAGRLPQHIAEEIRTTSGALQKIEGALRFRPCVLNPQKIVMIGLNYRKHAIETKNPIPEHPLIFSKFNNAIAAHEEEIKLPLKYASLFDYEAELIIVMGATASDVAEPEALDYVFGYCVGNDLSARDLQRRTSQMLLGKSLDGFAPIGPVLTGKSLLLDPDKLSIECAVNGEVKQSSSTSDMIFSCRELVSYISRHMTLYPGDLIFTGTPEGVAAGYPAGQQPWLVPDDVVSVTIEGLGTLNNRLIA